MSELWQHLPGVADELCMIHSVCDTNVAHGGATMKLHTGNEALVRPSVGSWISYGLGTENDNLPSYITGNIDYRTARTQFNVGDPPADTVRWYLVRVDCPVGSWSSGGANECPEAKNCPNGGRDANLP